MGRILAIDYGLKRTGLAVSDPLRIIATPLDVVATSSLIEYLKTYTSKEPVDTFVVGMPKTLMNVDSSLTPHVRNFLSVLTKTFPSIPVTTLDERFTSSIAKRTMLEGGMKKKDRREKGNVDRISATIILQDYLSGLG